MVDRATAGQLWISEPMGAISLRRPLNVSVPTRRVERSNANSVGEDR